MITIVADEKGIDIDSTLFNDSGKVNYIAVQDLNILPCYGCGSCTEKTFGRCILKDDMAPILEAVVSSSALILMGPIVFGGYSYGIKKVYDRFSVIGDARYNFHGGELTKGMVGAVEQLYVVGIKEDISDREKQTLVQLFQENLKIMNIKGEVVITEPERAEEELLRICQEVTI